MDLWKILIFGGIIFIALGVIAWIGFPFGKLPGDIHYKGESSNVYVPITTSIVISILLTLILNLIWYFKK